MTVFVGVVKIQNEASPFSLDAHSLSLFCVNFLIKTFITFYGFFV